MVGGSLVLALLDCAVLGDAVFVGLVAAAAAATAAAALA